MVAPTSPTHAARRTSGRAQQDPIADPYQAREKLSEPTRCRQCTAVYQHGRWQWSSPPENSAEALCPACQRIRDKLPAGIVTIHGDMPAPRRDEIVNLARHQEAAEIKDHPLNRIIAIGDDADGNLTISTTDIHLPRRIGEAAARAFHGTVDIDYDEDGYFVRVDWRPAA